MFLLDMQRSEKTMLASLPIMTDKQASKTDGVAESVLLHLQRYPKVKAVVFILDDQPWYHIPLAQVHNG